MPLHTATKLSVTQCFRQNLHAIEKALIATETKAKVLTFWFAELCRNSALSATLASETVCLCGALEVVFLAHTLTALSETYAMMLREYAAFVAWLSESKYAISDSNIHSDWAGAHTTMALGPELDWLESFCSNSAGCSKSAAESVQAAEACKAGIFCFRADRTSFAIPAPCSMR